MSNSLYISQEPTQDGVSQQQRIPQALKPEYIAVDERSPEDLLTFARALATEIRYYEESNTGDGNWEDFFADDIPDSAPHKAMFLSFLELFKYAREHMNTLTQRHLDFYYKEVLQLREKSATPDQVHVLFQLAKNIKSHLLKAGTLLKAGKDNNGVPVYYATEKDIVINKTEITSLKTLFVEKDDTDTTQNIYAAPVADSADGLGIPFEEENPQWEIFGGSGKGEEAAIGFALASPLLFLNEGERRIDILFTFSAAVPAEVNALVMADIFDIQLSSAEGWITGTFEAYSDPPDPIPDPPAPEPEQIGIAIAFRAAQPAITAYNKDIHGGCFNTRWPLMRIMLKDRSSYDLLYDLTLHNIGLTVHVSGVRNLLLQNDQGVLNPGKPFLPFGPQPVIGSSFYIGSGEIFQKRLESLTLNMDWLDRPEDFQAHYGGYYEMGTTNANDFEAEISLLYQRSWELLVQPAPDPENPPADPADYYFQIFGSNPQIADFDGHLYPMPAYERNSDPQDITKYDQHTQTGFIRLELTGPTSPLNAFGHKEYPGIYTEQAIALSRYDVDPMDAAYDPPNLPNAPYTPTIKSLSLDYTSTQGIDFQLDNNTTEQFFYITPFGHNERQVTENTVGDAPTLLPQYTDEGNLYIGLKDLEPPQQLSILFRPAEGSAAPDTNLRDEDIQWSYLAGGQWMPLETQIVSNTTKALQDTGIITFNMPSDASLQHSLMPEGLHWLRAAVTTGAGSVGKFIALSTQAVTAVFTDQGNDPGRLNEAMEANSITGLSQRQSAVKSVTQPYPSFNGKASEQSQAFYTRISEKLRHKARAVSGWDYERLILERFPSIYKIKCLNHTRIDLENLADSSENMAGHITLITLPEVNRKNAADSLEPKTSNKTLIEIGEYIQQYTSPFINIDIRNPRYEQLQLSFKVSFAEGVDQGYHQQLLEEELIRFLSPWTYEDQKDIVFGNEIYKSAVLDFVEKKSYVDFVTDFVLYHLFEDILPDPGGLLDQHPLDGEASVYHIFHYYPANPGDEEVALDCIIGFDEAVNIPVFLPTFLGNIDTFFGDREAVGTLNELRRAEVMKFIKEEHNEVAFIRELRFYHIEDTSLREDTERAVAGRPGAILTSAKTHNITLLDPNTYECPGTENIGINYMVIGGDFIVS